MNWLYAAELIGMIRLGYLLGQPGSPTGVLPDIAFLTCLSIGIINVSCKLQ